VKTRQFIDHGGVLIKTTACLGRAVLQGSTFLYTIPMVVEQ
jgi:hypothetical protein